MRSEPLDLKRQPAEGNPRTASEGRLLKVEGGKARYHLVQTQWPGKRGLGPRQTSHTFAQPAGGSDGRPPDVGFYPAIAAGQRCEAIPIDNPFLETDLAGEQDGRAAHPFVKPTLRTLKRARQA